MSFVRSIVWALWLVTGISWATPTVQMRWDGARLDMLDAGTGALKWSLETETRMFEPVRDGELVYVTQSAGRLLAVDASTGAVRWKLVTEDDWLYPPVIFGERIIVVGRQSGLHALRRQDGKQLWRLALQQEPTERPLAIDGRYLVLALFDGHLRAVDATDGGTSWQIKLETPALNMATDGRIILLGGYRDRLRAVSARDGSRIWQVELPGRLSMPALIHPAILVAATDRPSLLLVDRNTGRLLDQLPLAGEIVQLEWTQAADIQLLVHERNKASIQRVPIYRGNDPAIGAGSFRFSIISAKERRQ